MSEIATAPAVGGPVVRNAGELIAALAERKAAMGLPDDFIEDVAGFAPGHVAAVLDTRSKRPNLRTIDRLCEVLAVSIVLQDDPAKQRLMASRWDQRQVGDLDRAREGGKLRWAGMTREQRSAVARAAANARWSKPRG
jgi:hypothetical protein